MVYGSGLENQLVCKGNVGSNPTLSAHRGVAQFGRALLLGSRGRRFESCQPDSYTYKKWITTLWHIGKKTGTNYWKELKMEKLLV